MISEPSLVEEMEATAAFHQSFRTLRGDLALTPAVRQPQLNFPVDNLSRSKATRFQDRSLPNLQFQSGFDYNGFPLGRSN